MDNAKMVPEQELDVLQNPRCSSNKGKKQTLRQTAKEYTKLLEETTKRTMKKSTMDQEEQQQEEEEESGIPDEMEHNSPEKRRSKRILSKVKPEHARVYRLSPAQLTELLQKFTTEVVQKLKKYSTLLLWLCLEHANGSQSIKQNQEVRSS